MDDPGVARLKQHFQDIGWHPSPLPLGINRDDAHPQTSHCVRCTTCGGYPCLLKAKSDARSIVIDPIRNLPNVTILTGHKVKRIEAHGRVVTGVVTETDDGALQTFTADLYALSAGAANSAAILLQSATATHPNGLANSSGLVGRNYMFHTTSAVISILADHFDSTFPKTFAVNDFYFGDEDYPYPMGQIQLLEYMSGQTLEGQISDIIPPALIPDFLSNDLARHMVAFLTMTEDLPREENRVTVTETGQIKLTYTPNNLPAHLKLTQKLEHALKSFPCASTRFSSRISRSIPCCRFMARRTSAARLVSAAIPRPACSISTARRTISTTSMSSIRPSSSPARRSTRP